MSPIIYQIIHLLGVLLVFSAYGVLIGRGMLRSDSAALRKFGAITSGVGLVLILVGGFGLLAKLYDNTFHLWVILKLVLWVLLGGMVALINRKPELSQLWFRLTLLIGFLAVVVVYVKPGM